MIHEKNLKQKISWHGPCFLPCVLGINLSYYVQNDNIILPDSADDWVLDVDIDEGQVGPAVLKYLVHQLFPWNYRKYVQQYSWTIYRFKIFLWSTGR